MSEIQPEILMVEDNPNDAELSMLALKKAGINNVVKIVRDGAEALEFLFSEGKYAGKQLQLQLKVVFLDLKMPKVSGFQVLERIRVSTQFDSLPVVILSSSNVESDIMKAYKLGANSFIVKPIDYSKHSAALSGAAHYWVKINQTLLG
jgi:two-component system, response regulator